VIRSGAQSAAEPPRDRRVYTSLVVVTIILGLASRKYAHALPSFVAAYAGDTLWAAMVFFGLALLLPRRSTRALAISALAVAFAVEFSQLYHAPWLDAVRNTRLGALALGQGFLWSDLVCYTVGVAAAAMVDKTLRSRAQLP
jgi:hypothetical protein